MSESVRPPVRATACWLLLTVFALEFLLFDQVGARRHTGGYPRWDDQVQYLSESYVACETARAEGFGAALRHALFHPAAQGTLHDAAALFAFQLAGPSRSAALALNLIALLAWQTALFVIVGRRTGSPAHALAAALLPLALAGPWENIPGSAYDFRLDHFAMCALGVTSCLALLTDGFRVRGASFAFGAAVGLTLLTRFLTGTYLLLVFAGLLAWVCTRPDRRARIANLALAAFVALALAGPIFWLSRARILEYYWIGHFAGPEGAVRDAHLNVPASLAFVLRHLGERHLGIFFGGLAALGLGAFAVTRGERRPPPHGVWLIGALFILAPALVFTLHRQKSEVVLSALVPGVVILVLAGWLASQQSGETSSKAAAVVPLTLSFLSLAFFAQRQFRPAFDVATRGQIAQFNALADTLFERVTSSPFAEPGIAVDHLNDALNAEVLRVIFYERHGAWLPIKMTLPTGIVEPAGDDVMARVARSHLVLLTDDAAPALPYPFDHKLHAMRPQVRAWCEAHLRPAGHFMIFGRTMTLYQRPEIPFAPALP